MAILHYRDEAIFEYSLGERVTRVYVQCPDPAVYGATEITESAWNRLAA